MVPTGTLQRHTTAVAPELEILVASPSSEDASAQPSPVPLAGISDPRTASQGTALGTPSKSSLVARGALGLLLLGCLPLSPRILGVGGERVSRGFCFLNDIGLPRGPAPDSEQCTALGGADFQGLPASFGDSGHLGSACERQLPSPICPPRSFS